MPGLIRSVFYTCTYVYILWVTTQTQLLKPKKKKIGAGEINASKNKLCVIIVVVVSPCFWQTPPDAPSTAHGARSAAATELRRSRCCDGYAQTSSFALILRVASS